MFGLIKKSRKLLKNNDNADSLPEPLITQATDRTWVNKENILAELDSLTEEEKQLRIAKRKLLESAREIADRLKLKSDNIAARKSRLMAEMEKTRSSKQHKSENKSDNRLFSIETWGSAWNDGLVFTVIAENDVWAEEIVRQWLNSNGRENHKIDKVMALVSRDVRAVVNVGARLPGI